MNENKIDKASISSKLFVNNEDIYIKNINNGIYFCQNFSYKIKTAEELNLSKCSTLVNLKKILSKKS